MFIVNFIFFNVIIKLLYLVKIYDKIIVAFFKILKINSIINVLIKIIKINGFKIMKSELILYFSRLINVSRMR